MPLVSANVRLLASGVTEIIPKDPLRIEEYLTAKRLPIHFIGKANSFLAQRNAPGQGWLLLRRDQLAQVATDRTNHSLVFTAGTTSVTISNLHVYSAVGVTTTTAEKDDDVYLVEFRDRREHAQYTSINKGYNVRTPDWVSSSSYLTDTTNAGTAWTWATMIADIWTNISGIAGALTTTLADWPTTSPSNFTFYGCSALSALEHICESTDHHLICKRDGTFHIVSKGDTDATNTALQTANARRCLVPSKPISNDKVTIPGSIRVFFPKRNPAFQASTDQAHNNATELWNSQPTYSVTVTSTAVVPALTGVITSGTHPIYDSMEALYNELGTIQNAAALATQADKRATEYIQGQLGSTEIQNDLYHGAVEFQVGPLFDSVHWYDFGDGIRTQGLNPNSSQRKGNGCSLPISEWPCMPDLSRWHLPFERFAVGEVYGSTIVSGGSGIVRVQYGTQTSGTVTTWADTGLPHEIRGHNILEVNYEVGDRVFCAFHRQTSRWVIVNSPPSTSIVHFELTATLALSGDAAAIILSDDGADWADTATAIQVYDWYASEGMWAGISGYRGLAVKRIGTHASGREKYDIIWMEQIAQTIQFTSTEYMGATTAARMAVTVDWYDHQGKEPVATVIVRDPQGQFPDIHSGAKGTAVYDYHNGYYRVVSSQRVALFAGALLNGATCASSIALDNFAVKPAGDYVGAPPTTPTSASNTCNHAGLDNDPILLRRINNTMPNPTWECVDVALHSVLPITTVEISGGNLQYKTKTIYVEQCSTAESSATVIAATTTCP